MNGIVLFLLSCIFHFLLYCSYFTLYCTFFFSNIGFIFYLIVVLFFYSTVVSIHGIHPVLPISLSVGLCYINLYTAAYMRNHDIETSSALLALYQRSFDVFFDISFNKLLSKLPSYRQLRRHKAHVMSL